MTYTQDTYARRIAAHFPEGDQMEAFIILGDLFDAPPEEMTCELTTDTPDADAVAMVEAVMQGG